MDEKIVDAMSNPILAALQSAARASCFGHDGEGCDACTEPNAGQCVKWPIFLADAGATVSAFLRALPAGAHVGCYPLLMTACDFASEVEKAAKKDAAP